jgi:hypothetical protein
VSATRRRAPAARAGSPRRRGAGSRGRLWTTTGDPRPAASEQRPEPNLAARRRSTRSTEAGSSVFFQFGPYQVFSLALLRFIVLIQSLRTPTGVTCGANLVPRKQIRPSTGSGDRL